MYSVSTLFRLVQTELWKIKRYSILWAGVGLMFLTVLLTLFYSTAADDIVWTFPFLVEQVIKNNTTTIFPMCITLIAGYLIAREHTDDTWKNLATIPVSYRQLISGKLVVCGLLSLLFGVACAGFTLLANVVVRFPGVSGAAVWQALVQIPLNCLFLYLAVLPIIVAMTWLPNGHMLGVLVAFVYGYGGLFLANSPFWTSRYPILASLGLLDYRSYDSAVHWNRPACLGSLAATLALTVFILLLSRQRETKAVAKKSKHLKPKRGW